MAEWSWKRFLPFRGRVLAHVVGLGEHPGKSQLRDLGVLFTGAAWQCQGADVWLWQQPGSSCVPCLVWVCADPQGFPFCFQGLSCLIPWFLQTEHWFLLHRLVPRTLCLMMRRNPRYSEDLCQNHSWKVITQCTFRIRKQSTIMWLLFWGGWSVLL